MVRLISDTFSDSKFEESPQNGKRSLPVKKGCEALIIHFCFPCPISGIRSFLCSSSDRSIGRSRGFQWGWNWNGASEGKEGRSVWEIEDFESSWRDGKIPVAGGRLPLGWKILTYIELKWQKQLCMFQIFSKQLSYHTVFLIISRVKGLWNARPRARGQTRTEAGYTKPSPNILIKTVLAYTPYGPPLRHHSPSPLLSKIWTRLNFSSSQSHGKVSALYVHIVRDRGEASSPNVLHQRARWITLLTC